MVEKPIQRSVAGQFTPKLSRNLQEKAIEFVLFLAAFSAVATTVGILYILISESVGFFEKISLLEFLSDTQWTPLFADPHYGILPLLSGTLVTSVVSSYTFGYNCSDLS
jgi:phosphate transport system permease protein